MFVIAVKRFNIYQMCPVGKGAELCVHAWNETAYPSDNTSIYDDEFLKEFFLLKREYYLVF